MVNRIADRILRAVLPQADAAAPCAYRNVFCYCSGSRSYYKRCRDCTGGGSSCGSCTIVLSGCPI